MSGNLEKIDDIRGYIDTSIEGLPPDDAVDVLDEIKHHCDKKMVELEGEHD